MLSPFLAWTQRPWESAKWLSRSLVKTTVMEVFVCVCVLQREAFRRISITNHKHLPTNSQNNLRLLVWLLLLDVNLLQTSVDLDISFSNYHKNNNNSEASATPEVPRRAIVTLAMLIKAFEELHGTVAKALLTTSVWSWWAHVVVSRLSQHSIHMGESFLTWGT